jgi:hypothetical protein
LVLYTAYFDEADTHGPAPTIIMAGFLGSRAQWEVFGRAAISHGSRCCPHDRAPAAFWTGEH